MNDEYFMKIALDLAGKGCGEAAGASAASPCRETRRDAEVTAARPPPGTADESERFGIKPWRLRHWCRRAA